MKMKKKLLITSFLPTDNPSVTSNKVSRASYAPPSEFLEHCNTPRPPWVTVGSRSPLGWWCGLEPEPVTLDFWGPSRFSNERNQEKQAHPVLKYLVPLFEL